MGGVNYFLSLQLLKPYFDIRDPSSKGNSITGQISLSVNVMNLATVREPRTFIQYAKIITLQMVG